MKRPTPEPIWPGWSERFFALTEEIGVSLCAKFVGDEAIRVANASWPSDFSHHDSCNGPGEIRRTARFYLSSSSSIGSQAFDLEGLARVLADLGVSLAVFEWTLMRFPEVKAFCMRESEIDECEKRGLVPPKWGFGRIHPQKPDFKPHQLLAGPLIDFLPGRAFPEFGSDWRFEPVWLKVRSSYSDTEEESRAFRVSSLWQDGQAFFNIEAVLDPQQIPAAVLSARL